MRKTGPKAGRQEKLLKKNRNPGPVGQVRDSAVGSAADYKASVHVDVTRRELAEFVLGKTLPVEGNEALAELDGSLDRSHLMRADAHPPTVIEPKGKAKYNDGLEH